MDSLAGQPDSRRKHAATTPTAGQDGREHTPRRLDASRDHLADQARRHLANAARGRNRVPLQVAQRVVIAFIEHALGEGYAAGRLDREQPRSRP